LRSNEEVEKIQNDMQLKQSLQGQKHKKGDVMGELLDSLADEPLSPEEKMQKEYQKRRRGDYG